VIELEEEISGGASKVVGGICMNEVKIARGGELIIDF
jgi:hypothetical protein